MPLPKGLWPESIDEPTFPLGIYKGFAIIIDLDITGEIFEGIVEGVSINLAQLIKKFCPIYKLPDAQILGHRVVLMHDSYIFGEFPELH